MFLYNFKQSLTLIASTYLYQVDSLSISSIEGYTGTLECYLLVGSEMGQLLNWTWQFENTPINTTQNDKYSIESTNMSSILTIKNLVLTDRGYYYCNVSNSLGSHSRNITLRVKSMCYLCLRKVSGFCIKTKIFC